MMNTNNSVSALPLTANTAAANTATANTTPESQPANLLAHPQLWRAGQLNQRTSNRGRASGYPELDAQLPGGGWPRAGLAEVLHAQPGLGELRLLAPMLADISQDENRWIAWINPPAIPYAPALGRFGIRSDRLLMIHPKNHADALWAAEQAARSGTCSAVLIWLDEGRLKHAETRRLQIAAKQGDSLACLFRPTQAAQHASAAELRLNLHATSASASDEANKATAQTNSYSTMQVDVLKRRGGWAIDNIDIDLVGDDPIRRLQDIQQQLSLWQSSADHQDAAQHSSAGVDATGTTRSARAHNPLMQPLRSASVQRRAHSQPVHSQPVH